MILIFCTENDGGMLFNERRLSSDVKVCEDIKKQIGKKSLYVNEYSKELFNDDKKVKVVDFKKKKFWKKDYCFIENLDPKIFEEKTIKMIIYNWNRSYPADLKYSVNEEIWKKVKERKIIGNSHDEITICEYERG